MSFFFLLLRYTKRKPKGVRYCIKPAKCGGLPGPGAPQGNYVFEAMLDEIAEKLNMDPWELRLRNALPLNKPTIYGAKIGEAGIQECIDSVRNHPNAKIELGPNQGRGIAIGYWGNAGGESSAQLHINEDGTALVITGHPDIGGSRASMVNIAAEKLGIRL